MESHRKFIRLKSVLPTWVWVPVVGIAMTAFPLSLVVFPLVVIGVVRGLFGSVQVPPVLQTQKLLRWTAGLHVGLGVLVFAFPYGLFLQVLAALWHVWCALFWLAYERGMVSATEEKPRRLFWFMGWSGICFALAWGVVGWDSFVGNGIIRTDLYHQIFQQAVHLRDALFQSKMSPYQLPDGIRQLLEQGPEAWSQKVVSQVVATFYGVWIVLFFLYWNLCDLRSVAVIRRPLFLMFQLPDWTMVVLILCLGGWVLGQFPIPGWEIPKGVADLLAVGVGASLMGVLWWYALEGISLLIRLGAQIRRFWIFFGLALLVFFDAQLTAFGMMAVGVGAQIRRFIPQRKRS